MDVARPKTFQLFRTGSLPNTLRIPDSDGMSQIWGKEKRDMVGVHLGMEQRTYKQPSWDTGLLGVVGHGLGTLVKYLLLLIISYNRVLRRQWQGLHVVCVYYSGSRCWRDASRV